MVRRSSKLRSLLSPAFVNVGGLRRRATIVTVSCIMAAVGGAAITYWIQLSAKCTEQLVAAHRIWRFQLNG